MSTVDVDFDKGEGLVPAIVQDARTRRVLMLGYMNEDALRVTRESGHVTFYSRSRERLWMKGETSGNFLDLEDIHVDCDGDALLVLARPEGPVCHTGADTCWSQENTEADAAFLARLDQVIEQRRGADADLSYTKQLLDAGPPKVSQKVGEEAVETVVAALAESDDRLIDEASDLLYHLMVLLRTRDLGLEDVVKRLQERHR